MIKYSKYNELVKTNIDAYLNCSIDYILEDTDAMVFGGAVRDALTSSNISDVDILALPKASTDIIQKLQFLGFNRDDRMKYNFLDLYKDVRVIHAPIDYIKIIRGNIIRVQIIRPRIEYNYDLAHSVDIRACGVVYTCRNVYESIPYGIHDSINKVIFSIKDSKMNTNRLQDRVDKLLDRGWTLNDELTPYSIRNFKIEHLFENVNSDIEF